MTRTLLLTASIILGIAGLAPAGERLKVHEWGTFTSFQNELGEGLRRINTDDEPVPAFVHQMGKTKLFAPTDLFRDSYNDSKAKGIRSADPRVTMRLETPVVYFHLPPDTQSMTLDVAVDFRRGLLTQFFPNATALVDGKPLPKIGIPDKPYSAGSLRWSSVRVGEAGSMPETTDPVWLAPRQVSAAPVTVGNESEKYLFYRGVGDLPAPLKVIRHPDQVLEIRMNSADLKQLVAQNPATPSLADRATWDALRTNGLLWLVDVRPNGTVAFRTLCLNGSTDGSPDTLMYASASFQDQEYSTEKLDKLKGLMQQALEEAGLFHDEAYALLKTWELSYFQSPGQRLFFMVPRSWTEAVMPMKLSVPAEITRVMVGRIELVTPRQRQLLQQIAETAVPDLTAVLQQMQALKGDAARRAEYNAVASGRGDSSILGVAVPASYQAFLDLGRFRTSLLMDAADRDKQAATGPLNRVSLFQFEMSYPGKLKPEGR